MHTQITITGFVVGPIWLPFGAECYKHFTYDLTREDRRFLEPGTLRDHVLNILMKEGGDFQSCVLANADLRITVSKPDATGSTTRRRSWSLDRFPSIKDCLHEDPDWFPSGDES